MQDKTAEALQALRGQLREHTGYFSYAGFRSLQGLPESNKYLSLSRCGEEECAPGHSFDKARPEHHLHFILSGQGELIYGGKTYSLSAGDIFLIPAGRAASYTADMEDPWHYAWIAFSGRRSWDYLTLAGFHPESPVRRGEGELEGYHRLISDMLDAPELTRANELHRQGDLYLILALLAHDPPPLQIEKPPRSRQDYPQQAKELIEHDFATLTVQGLANQMGLNRSYLSDRFRAEFGCTPQEYLIKCRMEYAGSLLRGSSEQIQQIGAMAGYSDPLSFTKAFTRYYGMSPREYRKK